MYAFFHLHYVSTYGHVYTYVIYPTYMRMDMCIRTHATHIYTCTHTGCVLKSQHTQVYIRTHSMHIRVYVHTGLVLCTHWFSYMYKFYSYACPCTHWFSFKYVFMYTLV